MGVWAMLLAGVAQRQLMPARDPKDSSPPERILIIAPHCDDEVLSSGELIHNARLRGDAIEVVVMTNGDGYRLAEIMAERRLLSTPKDFIEFGYQRAQESLDALNVLGLPAQNVIFLGLPDRGVDEIWRDYLSPTQPYRSAYTKVTAVPYDNAYEPGAPYSALTVLNQLQKILEDFKPTEIIYPMPHDAHPDHRATQAFVEYVLESGYRAKMGGKLKERQYLVHRGRNWPWPRGVDLTNTLYPPKDLLNIGYHWEAVEAEDESAALKLKAIETYKSQDAALKKYLRSFARRNELFVLPLVSRVQEVAGPVEANLAKPPWMDSLAPLIQDPVGDTMSRDIEKGADFSAVYAAASEQSLFLMVKTAGKIPITTRFEADIKVYGDAPLDEIKLTFVGRKLKDATETRVDTLHTDTKPLKDVLGSIEGNQIGIRLPRKLVGRGVLFSMWSYANGHVWMDQTPYRSLLLEPAPGAKKPELP